jgi:hypothetical protein
MEIVPWTPIPIPHPRPKKPKPKPKLQPLPIVPIRRTDVEIKGLATQFAAAKARIAQARAATVSFDSTVGSFVSDLEDVTAQVAAMHSDLNFEAATLGNSVPTAAAPSPVAPVGAKPTEGANQPSVKVG